ncbi:MAG TPA: ABC transporter permease, partial [Candidatus Krumholzibacterium sp.]|nr:ABC transporter permease [Candidatus Krumholzibacterium sp.]
MLRHKVFSFINIIGLTIGMSFAILILIWVRHEYSFDRHNTNFDRLYRVGFYTDDREFYGDFVSGALAGYLRDEYPEIEKATRFTNNEGWQFVYDEDRFVEYGRMVDHDFFDMFDCEVVKGSTSEALIDPYSIVITESMADRIFGDDDPVGQALQVTPTVSMIVAAVVKDVPANSDMRYSFLVSIRLGGAMYEKWDVKSVPVYVLLSGGADPGSINSKIIDAYNDRVQQDTRNNIFLAPLSQMHLHGISGKGETFKYIVIFSLVAGAVLLIACINFMNLSTARAESRIKEIAVKKVLGAERLQLACQFLTESLLYSMMAFFVSVIVVESLIPVLNRFHGLGVDFDLSWSMIA